ncbi:MAG TPA: alpha/beta hydrolase [Exilispira sp.]|nr:alpha/beta hydrolase [Exilispira sp.]
MDKNLNFQINKISFSDGFYLYVKDFEDINSKNLLLIVPDIGETVELYDDFILNLTKNNFSVIIFDLPGHGNSDGRRGGFYDENVFIEIFKKLFSIYNIKNGIHVYISGIITPFIIKILYNFVDKIWLRSIFISSFTFSINYKFFISQLLNIILNSKFKLDLYPYLKDKTDDKKYLKKIMTSVEITRFIDLKMFFNIISKQKNALSLIMSKPIPIFIVIGKNQKAFKINMKNIIILKTKKKLPIKPLILESGHGIHLSNELVQEKCLKEYLDFISLC